MHAPTTNTDAPPPRGASSWRQARFAATAARVGVTLAGLILWASLGSCATVQPPEERITLDPMVLLAEADGVVRPVDPKTLFAEASEDYARRHWEAARRKFLDVARLFPESKTAPHALFNAGLALVRLERFEEALALFQEAAGRFRAPRDVWDALHQSAVVQLELKRWPELLESTSRLLEGAPLKVTERVETTVRAGLAHHGLGELALAERRFDEALALVRQHGDVPGLSENALVSQSQYLTGAIYQDLFSSIRFRLPVETMKRDLNDKSAFFLEAQSAYLRCVRLGNRSWAVAAGYQLGRLYEDFYRDMMAAEIPAELDVEERQIYFEELKTLIRPLVVRAIEVYERNLGMSDRLGGGGEWAEKTAARLEEMRSILRREFGEAPVAGTP
jgi:tetratricopeptide (TPR) repeat protein